MSKKKKQETSPEEKVKQGLVISIDLLDFTHFEYIPTVINDEKQLGITIYPKDENPVFESIYIKMSQKNNVWSILWGTYRLPNMIETRMLGNTPEELGKIVQEFSKARKKGLGEWIKTPEGEIDEYPY